MASLVGIKESTCWRIASGKELIESIGRELIDSTAPLIFRGMRG